MFLNGRRIRYIVPNTRKPFWEGVIIGETDRAVWVTVTTPGYEGEREWVPINRMLCIFISPVQPPPPPLPSPGRRGIEWRAGIAG